ncbi:AAA family ATPase [Polyangium sp. 15x6]|uniref:AAA family ATPase n=1 Tax=Polyangium sp. 15x6 TaxID=3042687 RepID=UPI00249CDAE6|nr:AAA family ATPase [Polyangium sp. 15x6]MDI3287078.1 AAA family ATPase [Polyangium sp. 15x6]
MRITHLSLRGYYGFRELELPFPEHGPTVLIGKNGAGKSTVLDAIAMFLAHFAALATSPPKRHKRGMSLDLPIALEEVNDNEVHSRDTAARVLALFQSGDERYVARAVFGNPRQDLDPLLANTPLDELVYEGLLSPLLDDRNAPVPVLAYYRPNRGVGLELGKQAKAPLYPQLAAYRRAFDVQVGPFQEFVRWFRVMEDQENEERLRSDPRFRNPRLSAVRSAIERFLSALGPSDFHDLRVVRRVDLNTGDERAAQIVIGKDDSSLPLDHLSDGERAVLLLVADLAMRFVVANPGAAEPLHGEGVVLIDELELHLHPAWQRRLLPSLGEVFPGCQFIATTHSPQVLSTLKPESVVILESFRRVEVTPPIYGRDTNAILRDAMGTSPRPQQAAEKLDAVARLIDAENFAEARKALDELSSWLGEEDPEIVRLRTLTHFLEG